MSNVFYSNGTRMRFEDKLKCSKCQAAMRKIGVKFENLEVVEVHKCLACGKRRTRKAKDLAIKSSPILEERDV